VPLPTVSNAPRLSCSSDDSLPFLSMTCRCSVHEHDPPQLPLRLSSYRLKTALAMLHASLNTRDLAKYWMSATSFAQLHFDMVHAVMADGWHSSVHHCPTGHSQAAAVGLRCPSADECCPDGPWTWLMLLHWVASCWCQPGRHGNHLKRSPGQFRASLPTRLCPTNGSSVGVPATADKPCLVGNTTAVMMNSRHGATSHQFTARQTVPRHSP
jgi:hypothetical protein